MHKNKKEKREDPKTYLFKQHLNTQKTKEEGDSVPYKEQAQAAPRGALRALHIELQTQSVKDKNEKKEKETERYIVVCLG
ncbi:unnamed protein product [Caenorhabditis nigoni]